MSNQKCKDAPGLVLRLCSVNEAATFLIKEKILFLLLLFFSVGEIGSPRSRVVIIFLLNLHN